MTRPKKPPRRPHQQPPPRQADQPSIQPGRRPSSPALLLFVALMWIGAGVIDLVTLSASWKLIPGIVFIGIGLLYLRGAAATVARRADRTH